MKWLNGLVLVMAIKQIIALKFSSKEIFINHIMNLIFLNNRIFKKISKYIDTICHIKIGKTYVPLEWWFNNYNTNGGWLPEISKQSW
jgi:hypothetical protein